MCASSGRDPGTDCRTGGENVYVQSERIVPRTDGFTNLSDRATKERTSQPACQGQDTDQDAFAKAACSGSGVRSFGRAAIQRPGISGGVRGRFRFCRRSAFPSEYRKPTNHKCVNSESSKMPVLGYHGHEAYGGVRTLCNQDSINCQLAGKPALPKGCGRKSKKALKTLFENDSSAASGQRCRKSAGCTGEHDAKRRSTHFCQKVHTVR